MSWRVIMNKDSREYKVKLAKEIEIRRAIAEKRRT